MILLYLYRKRPHDSYSLLLDWNTHHHLCRQDKQSYINNYMLLEIEQYCYNTTSRGSVKMSYQKLWLPFLPILLVNGVFTRSCCLIPYQIFLCVHTVTISSISDKTRVTRATVRGQYGNNKADIHCVIYIE